jgi:hypothetical protein
LTAIPKNSVAKSTKDRRIAPFPRLIERMDITPPPPVPLIFCFNFSLFHVKNTCKLCNIYKVVLIYTEYVNIEFIYFLMTTLSVLFRSQKSKHEMSYEMWIWSGPIICVFAQNSSILLKIRPSDHLCNALSG